MGTKSSGHSTREGALTKEGVAGVGEERKSVGKKEKK